MFTIMLRLLFILLYIIQLYLYNYYIRLIKLKKTIRFYDKSAEICLPPGGPRSYFALQYINHNGSHR